MIRNTLKFVFFGTDNFAVIVLNELKKAGFLPEFIITTLDKPRGRKLIITPPPTKIWAQENSIKFLQPQKLNTEFAKTLKPNTYNLFIVASYGKIIPKEILNIPRHGTLNVHPSLLPLFRGPSPIHFSILQNTEMIGVTIMLLDEEMDHGPIVAQITIPMPTPLPRMYELEKILAHKGGELLALTIPEWVAENIDAQEQDHDLATYTKMLKKEDGLINLNDKPVLNFRKIRAYDPWPGTYFFQAADSRGMHTDKHGKKVRIKIIDAELKDGTLKITRIIPEGKKEMNYEDFIKNT